ncbi:MAG: FAD-dependent oxidoreductase [Pseudomonadota bacterium]
MTGRTVLVIGAGAVGSVCALRLQERGFQVTLVDRDAPGQGASFGNASVIAATEVVPIASPGVMKNVPKWLLSPNGPLFLEPAYLPELLPWLLRFLRNSTRARTEANAAALASLCCRAVADTRAWLSDLALDAEMTQNASLRLYPSLAAIEADAYKLGLRKRHGVDYEIIDAAGIQQLEPCITGPYGAAVLTPGAYYLHDPVRPILRSTERLKALGGQVLAAEVARLDTGENAPAVRLSGGDVLRADHVVLAAGIWSGDLARGAGDRFPLESERGYHVQYTGLDLGLSRGLVDTARGFAVSPVEAGLRVAGTVEFRGTSAPLDPRRTRVLEKHARTMFGEGLAGKPRTTWLGHRPSLPDSLPVIGPSLRQKGLFYAFGHGHLGLTLAATTAHMIADMLGGHRPVADPAPFSANRF